MQKVMNMQHYINSENKDCNKTFCTYLKSTLDTYNSFEHDAIVLCCIGTDRSTGDSLAPIIGYKLQNINYNKVFIYGTLENPLHAKNLESTINDIHRKFDNPFVIAIDASLGRLDHVGFITIGEGSIKPGSGVGKDLPAIGNIHITGIVNFGGYMDFLVLQNTRLSVVMKMADIITDGLKKVLFEIIQQQNNDIKKYCFGF